MTDENTEKPAAHPDIKCLECGFEGNWDEVEMIRHDVTKVPACPECRGTKFAEQGDLFESEDEAK